MLLKLSIAAAVMALAAAVSPPADPPIAPGYLPPGAAFDGIRNLPPAPKPDSPLGVADREIFKATRALQGTPRWALAQNDVEQTTAAALRDFSCSVGVDLRAATAPRLTALLLKVRADIRKAVDPPKDLFQRQRPYLIDEGPICVAKTELFAKSPDYPSGHTTWAWTIGLILAELRPTHATDILVRARAYGESRVVCGVHNASAIDAGRTGASALVAALHGSAAFRTDMAAARAELRSLSKPPPAQACAAERTLTATTPW